MPPALAALTCGSSMIPTDLIQGARMIHGSDERDHDAPKALGLLRIERARRGLVPPVWLGSPDGAPPSPAQPPVRTKRRRAAMGCVRIISSGPEHEPPDQQRDARRKHIGDPVTHCGASSPLYGDRVGGAGVTPVIRAGGSVNTSP